MTDWFRSWHGAPTDIKWLVIAKKAKALPGIVSAVWFALEDHASQQADRGSVATFSAESYSVWSGFPEKKVAAVMAVMVERGLIVDGRLAAWDKRQPKREDGAGDKRPKQPKPASPDIAPQFPAMSDIAPQVPTISGRVEVESEPEKINNTTTTAREADFATAVAEAAGEALGDPATCADLASPDELNRWRDGGCDLRLDVLPTVRRLSRAKPAGSVKTWRFFSDAVFEARDKRAAARAPPPVIDITRHQIQPRQSHERRKPTLADTVLDIAGDLARSGAGG